VSKPLRLEEEADAEVEEATRWYEQRRPGLGQDFLASIDAVLDQISRLPGRGAPVPQVPRHLKVRRAPVGKFPYHVIYLEAEEAIRILAVAHDRRRPGYWLSRVE
jgi:toxin ParE1/3/4